MPLAGCAYALWLAVEALPALAGVVCFPTRILSVSRVEVLPCDVDKSEVVDSGIEVWCCGGARSGCVVWWGCRGEQGGQLVRVRRSVVALDGQYLGSFGGVS